MSNIHTAPLLPLVLYGVFSFLLVTFMIAVSYVLGQRHKEHATDIPYESGIMPTGAAWTRFDVKYFLLAVFFVIFDLEAVFIFAWAICLKKAGWAGYMEMLVFILILLAALGYFWRTGALDWSSFARQESQRHGSGPGVFRAIGGGP